MRTARLKCSVTVLVSHSELYRCVPYHLKIFNSKHFFSRGFRNLLAIDTCLLLEVPISTSVHVWHIIFFPSTGNPSARSAMLAPRVKYLVNCRAREITARNEVEHIRYFARTQKFVVTSVRLVWLRVELGLLTMFTIFCRSVNSRDTRTPCPAPSGSLFCGCPGSRPSSFPRRAARFRTRRTWRRTSSDPETELEEKRCLTPL